MLGASGFIGRWIAYRLGQAGAHLAMAVRNVAAMQAPAFPGELHQADLLDSGALAELVARVAPQLVFNLAGYGIDPAERDEAKAQRINADLLSELVTAVSQVPAPDWQGQRIVHTGSALEYGVCTGDLSETTRATPTTLYGKTKLAGTRSLQKESESMGIASVTARLFTVYGPGEHPGRLLPSLLAAARSGSPVDLTAGKQLRDFTYVEDVVEGLFRLGLVRTSPGDVVNLATGRLASVRQFIETAARIMGIPADNLRFGALPTRVEEMQHEPVSVRKLQHMLAWTPSITMEQGIKDTCKWISATDGRVVYG